MKKVNYLVAIMLMLLFSQIKAYSDDDYYVQTLSIGGDEKVENPTNIQTFKKEEIPTFNKEPVSGSVNNTVYVPVTTPVVPYYYPANTIIYHTGVPYYTFGTSSYRITQPAFYNNIGTRPTSAMSFNYHGHGFDYGFSSGNPIYMHHPVPYNPPPPPPPCCNNNHNNRPYPPQPINLPSNFVYKR